MHNFIARCNEKINFRILYLQPSDDSNKENSREIQLLREHLQQQTQQTKQALAQLILVREQLLTETNARIEAQVR